MDREIEELLKDSLKQANKGIKIRDTTTTETTETTSYTDSEVDQSQDTKDVGMSAEGDDANVEYNEIAGNQYNDSAVHNEGGGSE